LFLPFYTVAYFKMCEYTLEAVRKESLENSRVTPLDDSEKPVPSPWGPDVGA
jgi:hypothetical protein